MKLLVPLILCVVLATVYAPPGNPAPAATKGKTQKQLDKENAKRQSALVNSAKEKKKAAAKANARHPGSVKVTLTAEEEAAEARERALGVHIKDIKTTLVVRKSKDKWASRWESIKNSFKSAFGSYCPNNIDVANSKKTVKVSLAELVKLREANEKAAKAAGAEIQSLSNLVREIDAVASARIKVLTAQLDLTNLTALQLLLELGQTQRVLNDVLDDAKIEAEAKRKLQGELKNVKEERDKLKKAVEILINDKKLLRTQIAGMADLIQAQKESIDKLEDANAAWIAKNEEKAILIAGLTATVASLREKLNAKIAQVTELYIVLDKQYILMQNYTERIARLHEANRELKDTNKDLALEGKLFMREASRLQGQVGTLEKWQTETKAQVEALNKDIAGLNQEKTRLEGEHKLELQKVQSDGAKALSEKDAELKLKQAEITNLTKEAERFRTLSETSGTQVATLTTEFNHAKTTVAELQGQLTALNAEKTTQVAAANQRADAAQNATTLVTAEKARLEGDIRVLNVQLQQAEKTLGELKAVKTGLDAQVTALEKEKDSLAAEQKKTAADKAKTEEVLQNERNAALKVELSYQQALTKHTEYEGKIEEYKEQVRSLTGQITEMSRTHAGEIKDLNAEIKKLTAESATKETEVKLLQQSAGEMRERIAALAKAEQILTQYAYEKKGENAQLKAALQKEATTRQQIIQALQEQARYNELRVQSMAKSLERAQNQLSAQQKATAKESSEKSAYYAALLATHRRLDDEKAKVTRMMISHSRQMDSLEKELAGMRTKAGEMKAIFAELQKEKKALLAQKGQSDAQYTRLAQIAAARLRQMELTINYYKLSALEKAKQTAETKKQLAEVEEDLETVTNVLKQTVSQANQRIRLMQREQENIKKLSKAELKALAEQYEKEQKELAQGLKDIVDDAQFECDCENGSALTKIINSLLETVGVTSPHKKSTEQLEQLKDALSIPLNNILNPTEDAIKAEETQPAAQDPNSVTIDLSKVPFQSMTRGGPAFSVVYRTYRLQ